MTIAIVPLGREIEIALIDSEGDLTIEARGERLSPLNCQVEMEAW